MFTRSLLVAAVLLVLAPPLSADDITPPTILSFTASPAMVAAWDTVHITVTATDDVGVTAVTANGVGLENTSGITWEGDIPAETALGVHNVTVIARDAANNSDEDTSATYKTAQVVGMPNDRARDPVAQQASSEYIVIEGMGQGDLSR